MATLINMCPNCKSNDIEEKSYGKYTGTGCLLIVLGIPLLFIYGFGLVFIIIGIIMASLAEARYKCRSCKTEWK